MEDESSSWLRRSSAVSSLMAVAGNMGVLVRQPWVFYASFTNLQLLV